MVKVDPRVFHCCFSTRWKKYLLPPLSSAMLLLAACAPSSPPRQASTVSSSEAVTSSTPATPVAVDATAQQLDLALQRWQSGDDLDAAHRHLLNAATEAISSERPHIAQQVLLTLLAENTVPAIRSQAQVLSAQLYLDDPTADHVVIEQWLREALHSSQSKRLAQQLLLSLLQQQGRWNDILPLLAHQHPFLAADAALAWQSLNMLSSRALLAYQQDPVLGPFVELQQLVREAPLHLSSLPQQLDMFRARYAVHPVVAFWPLPDDAFSSPLPVFDKVAVLLPLSGKFAPTGNAIRAGILQGYFQQADANQSVPELHFFDTEALAGEELLTALASYSVILGPLRREVLATLTPHLAENVLLLSLNTPESPLPDATAAQHFYFALSPEQEAEQVAEALFAKGITHPILTVSNNPLYQRMYQAFLYRWQQLYGDVATHTEVIFSDNDSLRKGITQALGVAQSKERIDQIKFMTNAELHYMARNRVDIDAVAIFASAEETELLNPIIEASLTPSQLSTFVVMATSRSIVYESKLNQWRDLHDLYFFDMPWLLTAAATSPARQAVNTAWPDASTQFLRFFAFGYDAYQLLPHLSLMHTWPRMQLNGLSGKLRVTPEQQIVRELAPAQVKQRPVLLGNGQG